MFGLQHFNYKNFVSKLKLLFFFLSYLKMNEGIFSQFSDFILYIARCQRCHVLRPGINYRLFASAPLHNSSIKSRRC